MANPFKRLKNFAKDEWRRWARDATFNTMTAGGYSAVKSVLPGGVIHESVTGNEARRREQLDAERREQEYNDPVAQRARLEVAGINPLHSGISSGSSGVSAPGVGGFNPLEPALQIAQLGHTMASTKNLFAQNKLLAEQTRQASSVADISAHDAGVYTSRPGQASTEGAVEGYKRDVVSGIRRWVSDRDEKKSAGRKKFEETGNAKYLFNW